MAKNRKEEPPKQTNAWLTTYTDLMTLLLTFFVLLLSISTVDDRRKREALNSLVGAFGFKPGAHSVLGKEQGINLTVGTAPMVKEQIHISQLQSIAFKNGFEADVKINKTKDKLILSLSNKVLFKHESKNINQQARKYLLEVAHILKDTPGKIELRGYADQSETVFDPDPFKKAVFLSTERALAVFHFFNTEGKMPAKKLVSHGFGTELSSFSPGGTTGKLNRQVEIICDLKAKVPYHLRKKNWTREFSLDFKGFLFNLKGDKDG